MIQAKLCLLGEVSVGKTSLVRRFVDRSFSDAYLCTVGVSISRKRLSISNGPGSSPEDIELILWDLEGGNAFAGIAPSYLRGARAALVVADCTRQETVNALENHIERFRSTNPDGVIAVALNKTDLLQTPAQGLLLPLMDRTVAVQHTSARTGSGVDELFLAIGRQLLQDLRNGPLR